MAMAYHDGHWHESAPSFAIHHHSHLLFLGRQRNKNDDDGNDESHTATKDEKEVGQVYGLVLAHPMTSGIQMAEYLEYQMMR